MAFNAYFRSSDELQADFSGNSEFDAILSATAISGAKIYYDTKENWDRQIELVAQRAAIYVYSNAAYRDDGQGNRTPIPYLKVGDGTSYLIDMPFVNSDLASQLMDHIANRMVHVTEAEKTLWNNKVTCYIDPNDPETIIFSKE